MGERFSNVRLSISTRLTLWYGLSLLILLSLFVIFLYASFHISLHRDFEEQLRGDEAQLREAVRIEAGRPVLQANQALRSVAYQTDGAAGTYVRLLSPADGILFQSPNFSGRPRLAPSLPHAIAPVDVARTWQGAPARSRYAPLKDDQGQLAGWLEVTRLESALHRELHRLRWLLALGILLGTALAIGSGYGLARRALRPVATITRTARKIQAEELGQRIPTGFGVRDELTDLAETLNALLARLDASFERERRFRADAAHEMFTPISAIQSELEVALRCKRDPEDYEQTLDRVLDHTRRLAGIVDGLLQLSRAESFEQQEPRATSIVRLVHDRLARFGPVAKGRDIRLALHGDEEAYVSVAPGALEAVLENLIDNAIKYTSPGGAVIVTVDVRQDDVAVTVQDTGIGFEPDQGAHLFDRFYRADTPSVQDRSGSGLGLAIVRAVVQAYGGTITAQSDGYGQGSLFEVRLPRA